jgi:LuxR family quorum sensing-dependent transcriptional regulator
MAGAGRLALGVVSGHGEETIRSHLKKAQTKLGARNRTHAACEALRRQLVP